MCRKITGLYRFHRDVTHRIASHQAHPADAYRPYIAAGTRRRRRGSPAARAEIASGIGGSFG